jgi:hypothetical protein
MARFLDGAGDVVRRELYFATSCRNRVDALSQQPTQKGRTVFGQIPMGGFDLLACQADEAITTFDRVIEESELVLAGKRREPK